MRRVIAGSMGVLCLQSLIFLHGQDLTHTAAPTVARLALASPLVLPDRSSPRVHRKDSSPDVGTRIEILQRYRKMPLRFEANSGASSVEGGNSTFLARGDGYSVLLAPDEAALSLRNRKRAAAASLLQMRLVGAKSVAADASDELPGRTNYFIGNDPSRWRTNVPNYAKVRYRDVYPGIDLVYYGNQGQLEYDFVVCPGADPGVIRLVLTGLAASSHSRSGKHESLHIAANGDLVIRLQGGHVRFHKPAIYQPSAASVGSRDPIDGRYQLTGRNQFTFELGAYDHTKPLVIDPALAYSTYLGGSEYNQGSAVALDDSGNAYVVGWTDSANFPTTPGAFQTMLNGSESAFVTKFNSTASALVYSTFLDGTSSSYATGVAVDAAGDTFVTGYTTSQNFPVTGGAFDTSYPGGTNSGFVTELDPTGSSLVYSTYLGGDNYNQPTGIAIGPSGKAYVTGQTNATNFPVTGGAFQIIPGGGYDAFVSVLNTSGSNLVYSTYLGGTDDDSGTAIAVDGSGDAYLTGNTESYNFPTTKGAYQTFRSGFKDAFITKMNAAGSAPVYSSYLGGTTSVYAYGLTIDKSGDVYVTGSTNSEGFPITPGAFQKKCNCGGRYGDAYVTEFNSAGSALVYSTYLGYAATGYGIAVDSAGDSFVTGSTSSSSFPTTPDAFQTGLGGRAVGDVFFSEFNPGGTSLLYSTYLGTQTAGLAIALDARSSNVYLTGYTAYSGNQKKFPTTKGAYQVNPPGYNNGFLSIFSPSANGVAAPASLTYTTYVVGTKSPAQTVTLTNYGERALNIKSLSLIGPDGADFTETNTCGSSVAAGASCDISIVFAPLLEGTLTATLSVVDNSPNTPQQVALSGIGTLSGVVLTPANLTYPAQAVFTSATQTLTLTNTGTGTLTITSITISGVDSTVFSESNTCGGSVPGGGSCTFSVVFSPQAAGTLSAQLKIFDNAPNSPQDVPLNGLATDLLLSPPNLTFGNQAVGTSSPPQALTIMNKASSGSVTLGSVTLTGADPKDFSFSSKNCGTVIGAGEICTLNVVFTPTATGSRTANLSVKVSGGISPQPATLSGTGD